jgi:hypothetical protein
MLLTWWNSSPLPIRDRPKALKKTYQENSISKGVAKRKENSMLSAS